MSYVFVANFVRFAACKNFGNWLRFDKVTDSLNVGTVFATQCSYGHDFNIWLYFWYMQLLEPNLMYVSSSVVTVAGFRNSVAVVVYDLPNNKNVGLLNLYVE